MASQKTATIMNRFCVYRMKGERTLFWTSSRLLALLAFHVLPSVDMCGPGDFLHRRTITDLRTGKVEI